MLGVSAGKVVGAAEILLRTHVEIVVVDVVEHGIDAATVGMRIGPGGSPGLR